MSEVTLAVAALAGLGSFVAPCILPMIPAFLAYISGTTISEFNQKNGTKSLLVNRTNIILNTVFFLLTTKFRSLNIEKKFIPKREKASYPLSFLFGLAFAAGWTPCVGPILGTILTLAAATPAASFNLLLAYSLGLGIPFILIGVFFSRATGVIQAMSKHLKYYSIIIGCLIIILGVLVLTNQLAYIANFPLLNDLIQLG